MDLPPYVKERDNPWINHGVSTDDYCAYGDKALTFPKAAANGTSVANTGTSAAINGTPASTDIAHKPVVKTEAQRLRDDRIFFRCIRSVDSFEWRHMRDKDALARKYLPPIGVHYIDTKPALIPRKVMDPEVAVDGLHWWYGNIIVLCAARLSLEIAVVQ
jgi:hypothetical protein